MTTWSARACARRPQPLPPQSLTKTIEYPGERIRLLDEFRRQRAIGLYDGSFDPTRAEISALLETAEDLKNHLTEWLRKNKPELIQP